MLGLEKSLKHENSFYSIFRNLKDQKAKIRVELKNDGIIRGTLSYVDKNMNFFLTEVEPDAASFTKTIRMKSCFIRGSSVKFVHILKNQLDLGLIQEAWTKEQS